MVKITDLSDKLGIVGEAAHKLDNGYDLLARLERGQLNATGFVEKSLALWKQFEIIINLNYEEQRKKSEAVNVGVAAESAYNSVSDPAVLAVRLLGHDDVHATVIMNDRTGGIIFGLKRDDNCFVNMALNDKLLFPAYEVTRIYATAIPYLATGRQELLIANAAIHLPELLSTTGNYLAPALYELQGIDSITSDEHIALYQLLRNASTHLLTERIDVPVNISVRDYLSANGNAPMRVLKVVDAGLGIPPEVLPKLFGTYSSKPHGSGLGLRIVKRLADLRDGWVDVTSTQHNSNTFRYSTATNSVSITEPAPRGTAFELHLKALQPATA